MTAIRNSITNKKTRTKALALEVKSCYCKKIGGICMRCKSGWFQRSYRVPGPSVSRSFQKLLASTFESYTKKDR